MLEVATHPAQCPSYWEAMMRFYNGQHPFYCGIDLHARSMHLCILDQAGQVVFDRNLSCRPETFLRAIAPFRDGLVVGVECMFAWYWVADLCKHEGIAFVLGHAPFMRTIPGVGKVLALILLYEMHDVQRFERAGQFLSYARLVRCAHESAGKKLGSGGKKIGNAHLRWAFAEAACLFLRSSERAKQWKQKQAAQRGEGEALAIRAGRLVRWVYHMLRAREVCDGERFWQGGTRRTGTGCSSVSPAEANHAGTMT